MGYSGPPPPRSLFVEDSPERMIERIESLEVVCVLRESGENWGDALDLHLRRFTNERVKVRPSPPPPPPIRKPQHRVTDIERR
jgi:hypothetical protein